MRKICSLINSMNAFKVVGKLGIHEEAAAVKEMGRSKE